ncbi:MAG: sialidase family protein [Thermoleophilia bacterium]
MRRTPLLVTATALALLGAGAGVAAAATPLNLGAGDQPRVFVDRQGITHVTYDVTTNNQTHTMYRRALPGSLTFSAAVEIPFGTGEDFNNPYVVQDPTGNRLVMVTERCCTTGVPELWASTSTDGGVTWTAAVGIAEESVSGNAPEGRFNTVADGPAGLYLIDGNPSMRLATVPPALTPEFLKKDLVDISPDPYNGQVVLDAAGAPVFGHSTLADAYARFGVSGADIPLFHSSTGPGFTLASGAGGILAVSTVGDPSLNVTLHARLIAGGVPGADQLISESGDKNVGVPYATADASGRYHVVWRGASSSLMYRSSTTGTSWGAVQTLVKPGGSLYYPVVSAGADANGWVVYQDGLGASSHVRAVPIGPWVDPAVPDTTGITNPVVRRSGGHIFVTPKTPSLTDLKKTKCVNVRVQTTKPATIRVAIFSGRKSIRIFGSQFVRFKEPGKRLVCIRVPLRAHTFDVRQPFRFAFAVKDAAAPKKKPAVLTTTAFTTFG